MSKLVQREWERYGEGMGEVLPKLTASIARKVAVSTLREAGGDRQDQETLARHMAHKVTTADKYYDQSELREDRQRVMGNVTKLYKVCSMLGLLNFNPYAKRSE